jgi:trans-aconitate methyltransferase
MTDRIALARAWWTFRPNGLAALGFLAARVAIVPWRQLDPELRNMHGRVLSLGCGFGIVERYLVQVCPDAQVEGFELDAERVLAAAKSSHLEPRVTVRHLDIIAFADGEVFDSVLAVDVFHHIPST